MIACFVVPLRGLSEIPVSRTRMFDQQGYRNTYTRRPCVSACNETERKNYPTTRKVETQDDRNRQSDSSSFLSVLLQSYAHLTLTLPHRSHVRLRSATSHRMCARKLHISLWLSPSFFLSVCVCYAVHVIHVWDARRFGSHVLEGRWKSRHAKRFTGRSFIFIRSHMCAGEREGGVYSVLPPLLRSSLSQTSAILHITTHFW